MKTWWNNIWLKTVFFFSVVGPGIISANADNDAGGITTYSVVGAHYGTAMLWVLLLITISLAITQEMGVRIGLVTRQGLGGVIRENYGVRWTAFAVVAMLIANFGTVTAEFAGIAAAFSIIGVNKYIAVPGAALIIWFILYKGSFKTTQKIFLIFSAFYIVYIVNGFMVGPDFGQAFQDMVTPTLQWNAAYMLTLVALIKKDLKQVKDWLEQLGIKCGSIHNPSKKVDPNYWRFFIGVKSYERFARIIGSWHPVKSHFLRMKI